VATYAKTTTVSPEKSRMEIEQILTRYGAEKFMYATEPGRAMVMFEIKDRTVRFVIPIPAASDFARFKTSDGYTRTRTAKQRDDAWAQELRRRWRALCLCIKARLEGVESGIETLEEAFLAHMVLTDGRSFAEWATPQLAALGTTMPPMLPGEVEAEIIDIEEARS
jgi:hypothetical protein